MRKLLAAFCLSVGFVGVAPAADSLHFRFVGQWDPQQPIGSVAVKGEYAYAAGDGNLFVISVADPSSPVEVARCSTSTRLWDVAVSGDYAYVVAGDSNLRVFSISDPLHPAEVGRCSTQSNVRLNGVAVSGDYAYAVGSGIGGLVVFSVADPTHPTEAGRCGQLLWGGRYPEVAGDYVYFVDDKNLLRIISVADPLHPVAVAQYTPGYVTGATVSDGYAFVGCESSFVVASIADPANPVEVGRLDSAPCPVGMARTHGYVFTSAGHQYGLFAYSVSDPTRPAFAGYYRNRNDSYAIAAAGDYLYYGGEGLSIYQFFQLGDLDIDNDSLDITSDTMHLRKWTTHYGDSLECARGEFILANTSAAYNPDPADGPSISPVDSLSVTGTLTGPGGTIDSIVILNLPGMLAQGQSLVCTLAAYVPVGLPEGDYTGTIIVSGKDTEHLLVQDSCCVLVRKLGDLDVDNDSLSVVADTMRLSGGRSLGEFVLANTSPSYNPDTADGPSLSPVDSVRFTGSLSGPGGTLDSILIPNLPASLAVGQAVTCSLRVYVPPGAEGGDYSGTITISGRDTTGYVTEDMFHIRLTKQAGDLDVDGDTLDLSNDTMDLQTQPAGPVYSPYAKAEFMLVNTSSEYNPDAGDGPSRSTLRDLKVEARIGTAKDAKSTKVRTQAAATDSVYVPNLPESLAAGQAVECTLALVIPVGESLQSCSGPVIISAYDTLGYQVQDSFYLVVRGPQPRQSLDSLRVAPIPFKPNQNPEHDAIHFQGLSAGARVTVYDASGQTVWSAVENGDGHLKWDANVASGIYAYLVVSADGKSSKVGKLSVIR
jgi:hypothetical protein